MLALVVSDDAYLYLLLHSEIHVIVHLASDEGICLLLYCLWQKEITCSATYCDSFDWTLKQFVAHGAFDSKSFLHECHKITRRHRLRELSHYSTSGIHASLFGEEPHVRKSQFFRHLEVHATTGVVHIGMHRHYADVMLNSLDYSTLHIVSVTDALQSAEQQRVMRHNEITSPCDSLINDCLVDVKTQ